MQSKDRDIPGDITLSRLRLSPLRYERTVSQTCAAHLSCVGAGTVVNLIETGDESGPQFTGILSEIINTLV